MKIMMMKQTYPHRIGDIVDKDEKIAKRWIKNGIAFDVEEEIEEEIEEGYEVEGVEEEFEYDVEDSEEDIEEYEEVDDIPFLDYREMGYHELRSLAKEKGLSVKNPTKEDLVDYLQDLEV